jgi:hypothetical protein
MHRAADEAARMEKRGGTNQMQAVQARLRARAARDHMLTILGITPEALVAEYSLRSSHGRDALALGRY